MDHNGRHKIIKLPIPDFSEKEKIGYNTGYRPYRKTGIRIEVENIKNKTVIHNYGHGGGGASLFFGSCKQSIEKFDEFCKKTNFNEKDITVLGSG
jgi:hypothetical protein